MATTPSPKKPTIAELKTALSSVTTPSVKATEEKATEEKAPVKDASPSVISSETPEQSAARYGIKKENLVPQIPSGTHLHPDFAGNPDNSKKYGQPTTDGAYVKTIERKEQVFAGDSKFNDKFTAPVVETEEDPEF